MRNGKTEERHNIGKKYIYIYIYIVVISGRGDARKVM